MNKLWNSLYGFNIGRKQTGETRTRKKSGGSGFEKLNQQLSKYNLKLYDNYGKWYSIFNSEGHDIAADDAPATLGEVRYWLKNNLAEYLKEQGHIETIRIKMGASKGTYEWKCKEEGSYEDHKRSPDHVYAILDNFSGQPFMNVTLAEANTLLESISYHTNAGWDGWESDQEQREVMACWKGYERRIRKAIADHTPNNIEIQP